MLSDNWHHPMGAWFIISLLFALWAIFSILQNQDSGPFSKALWTILVLFVPFFGFVLWLFFGPKAPKKN